MVGENTSCYVRTELKQPLTITVCNLKVEKMNIKSRHLEIEYLQP